MYISEMSNLTKKDIKNIIKPIWLKFGTQHNDSKAHRSTPFEGHRTRNVTTRGQTKQTFWLVVTLQSVAQN